ncbi:MAG: hypothetical protein A2W99_03610 [Bacteroidetes bacterium GWF2_33_16]|nr:MAG: hypothetical protein A2X00_11460 [Bacteroidetes bacterium GWE2_32_14]OFY08272.1 MAG: hypothetical protein A2W99_03610 [Bacteroidetes bacterium GWF2_33_16]
MKKTTIMHSIKRFIKDALLKKSIFIFILGLLSFGIFANPPLASKQQIGMFKNSITCVVLENGIISYNVFIKDAIEKYWKYNEYEFIDQEEFNKRRFDSKYSFLVLMKGVYEKDPGGVSYNYISLVLGDKAIDITDMPEICSIPFAYAGDNDTYFGYAIPAIVKFMQKHAKNLETKRFLISLKGLKHYNSLTLSKSKVLLLNIDQMAPDANTLEKIKTVYPFYVKLLTPSEIQTELDTDPINTMFNFHVGPTKETGSGKCFEMIFDVEGNLYYYNYRMVTNENKDGFNLKDFHHIR